MFISSPALAANVAPIPFLSPQWDWQSVSDDAQPARAEDLLEILMEGEPMNLRLNTRGLAAQRRFRPERSELAQQLEEQAPGVLEDLYIHHVDQGEHKAATADASAVHQQASLPEKRRLWVHHAANKQQRVSVVMPPMDMGDRREEHGEASDPARVLRHLLSEMTDDEDGAAEFWENTMHEISQEVNKLKAKDLVDRVPVGEYRSALKAMEAVISQCTANGRWESESAVPCLKVASTAMEMLSVESMSGKVYSDDLLQSLVNFVDGYITRVVLPALEEAFKRQQEVEGESSKKRGRKSRTRDWRAEWVEMSGRMSQVLMLLTDVVKQRHIIFQDSELLRISQVTLTLFFVDGADAVHQMQQTSVMLLQAVFANYPGHRENILQEMVIRASSWKPAPKECCYALPAPRLGHIQMLTALLFQMLQACAERPSVASKDFPAAAAGKNTNPALPLLVSFIKQVMEKLNVKRSEAAGGTGFKLVFQHLVADAAKVVGLPDWPIASLVLRAMWKFAYDMCTRESFPLVHRAMAAEILGSVVVRIKQLLLEQKAPAVGGSDAPALEELRAMQEEVLKRSFTTAVLEAPLASAGEVGALPKLYAQQALLNHLVAASARGDSSAMHAHRSWVMQWCEESEAPAVKACYDAQWDESLTLWRTRLRHREISAAQATAFATFAVSPFDFAKMLAPLLSILKHPKLPAYRQKALKGLSLVVDLDPEILASANVRSVVLESMNDISKSVRAEAVLLVGKFMCQDATLTLQYYESICARCKDAGTSVRKAAMQILRDLMGKEGQEKKVLDAACVAIIPLLKDESADIQAKTSAFLKEMWFLARASHGGDGEKAALSLAARFEQVKAVVDAAHACTTTVGRDASSITDVLEGFVRDAIKSSPTNKQACHNYCQEALQAVIRESEREDPGVPGAAADLLRLFRTLALFARVQPSLIAKDMELLHQHLSSQQYGNDAGPWQPDQCQLIGTVAAIYVQVLPVMADHPAHLVKYLQEDLPKLVQFAPTMQLLSTSIECVCALVSSVGRSHRKAREMHTYLARFLRIQLSKLSDPQFTAKPRALIIAGLVCRFSGFSLAIDGKQVPAVTPETVKQLYDSCINNFVKPGKGGAYRRAGFSCLGSLFVRDPSLILREASKKVLSDALIDLKNEDIVLTALRALADFIEEDVSDTDATCLRNNVMQHYLERILACGYCAGDATASAALRLVSLIHERGQVHPQMLVADMVAVQQRSGVCAVVGFQVLKAISDKYPDYYTPEVFASGVLRGYTLLQPSAAVALEAFARSFELRLPNKKFVQRTSKHVVDLIRKGSVGPGELRSARSGRVAALRFLAAVVTALPFPDWECVAELIKLSGEAGIELGTGTMTALKMSSDAEIAAVDPAEQEAAMEEAARALILLEIRRFILANYSPRSTFPVEVSSTLTVVNLLEASSTRECYSTLKAALRLASEKAEGDGGATAMGGGRGSSAKKLKGAGGGKRASGGKGRVVTYDQLDAEEEMPDGWGPGAGEKSESDGDDDFQDMEEGAFDPTAYAEMVFG